MKKKFDLIALASIPLIVTLGNSMFIPVLPTMERELDITAFQSSLIITVYSIVAIILIPISGYLSDKFGRKKVIIPSLILTGIGGAIAAFASWKLSNAYTFILLGRFIQGIGASGAFPVVIPTVGDMFDDEKDVSRGLGFIETSNTMGKVLSPILGSLFALITWFFPFVVVPAITLISILLVGFLVKPPKEQEEQKNFTEFFENFKIIFKNNARWLIGVFLIGCISMFVLFGFQFHLSNLLENQYRINGISRGLILAVPLLFLCSAAFLTGKKIGSSRNLMKWLTFSGYVLVFGSLIFIQPEQKLMFILSLMTIAGIGIGISLPCLDSLITEGIEKAERGTITSIYSSMRYIGVAAGPPAIALMMNSIPNFIYVVLSCFGGLAALASIFLIRPNERKQEDTHGLAQKITLQHNTSSLFKPKQEKD
ncbi:ACDE family multidrug resistance protein [Evansella vedderi]|uniref:ACDE family multidrug resistance protein n=1 Tax=Evansella vedderi TaxID=38282 RepID=A0ABT9ZQR6_9BACI|nr:MFS transporter [Evansella vedderi]MDQ0253582.1 ACDE family multidrug resistance protein [Evansella vedderi]